MEEPSSVDSTRSAVRAAPSQTILGQRREMGSGCMTEKIGRPATHWKSIKSWGGAHGRAITRKEARGGFPWREIVEDLDLEEIEQEPDGGDGADSRELVGRWRAAATEEQGKDELGKVRIRL